VVIQSRTYRIIEWFGLEGTLKIISFQPSLALSTSHKHTCVGQWGWRESTAAAKSREVEVFRFVLKAELGDVKYLPAFSSTPVLFSPVPPQL